MERLLLGMKPIHEMKKTDKSFVYDRARSSNKMKLCFVNDTECKVDELIALMHKIIFLNARKNASDGFINRKYYEDNKYITLKALILDMTGSYPDFRWALYPINRDIYNPEKFKYYMNCACLS